MIADPLGRDQYTGRATPAQYAAVRRWASRRDRWAPHTERDRLADHEAEEARTEQQQTFLGGNR